MLLTTISNWQRFYQKQKISNLVIIPPRVTVETKYGLSVFFRTAVKRLQKRGVRLAARVVSCLNSYPGCIQVGC